MGQTGSMKEKPTELDCALGLGKGDTETQSSPLLCEKRWIILCLGESGQSRVFLETQGTNHRIDENRRK